MQSKRQKFRRRNEIEKSDSVVVEPTKPDPDSKEFIGDRTKNLTDMGFKGYSEYLKSCVWRMARDMTLSRDRERCASCGKRGALDVHHKSYSKRALLGLEPWNLVTLCRGCHERIEFTGDGRKRTMREVDKVLRKMLNRH